MCGGCDGVATWHILFRTLITVVWRSPLRFHRIFYWFSKVFQFHHFYVCHRIGCGILRHQRPVDYREISTQTQQWPRFGVMKTQKPNDAMEPEPKKGEQNRGRKVLGNLFSNCAILHATATTYERRAHHSEHIIFIIILNEDKVWWHKAHKSSCFSNGLIHTFIQFATEISFWIQITARREFGISLDDTLSTE